MSTRPRLTDSLTLSFDLTASSMRSAMEQNSLIDSMRSCSTVELLIRYQSGVLISWLMPATSSPSDDIFSACTS